MNSKQRMAVVRKLVGAGAALIAIAFTTNAQVNSTTQTEHGPTTQTIKVETGEVLYVSGNDLVVKMADGEVRHFPNVPDSATATVDGKQLTVHDLKPGMKLQRTTVTSTTPRMITTIRTVTGKVFHVSPPNSVILSLEDGKNQSFKIPKGQKFTINGQKTDAFGLKKGMTVSVVAITEVPEIVVAHEVKRTGKMPPPPPPEPLKADVPMLVASAPAAAPPVETAAAEPAPTKLPKTGSYFPLVGLLGALSVALGLALKAIRVRQLQF
jgi:hypothetical protein